MQSVLTGSFLLFGSCDRHSEQISGGEARVQKNQIQASCGNEDEDEILISVLGTLSLDDVDHMEIQHSPT